MKKRNLIFLKWIFHYALFHFLFWYNAFSQDSLTCKTQHLIILQTGYSRHIVQDDIISSLVYRGSQIPVVVNYQVFTNKTIQSLSIYFDYLKLTSSITIDTPASSFYTKNYNAFIDYSYYRKLCELPKSKSNIFIGGFLKSFLNVRDHFYTESVNYTTGEFNTSIGISLMGIKRFTRFPKDFLSFRVNMPILAYDALNYLYNVNVPKNFYSTDASKNTYSNLVKFNRPVTINKYFEIQAEITYVKFLSNYVGIEFSYYFQYYNSEKFKNLFFTRCLNIQYLVGLTIKI